MLPILLLGCAEPDGGADFDPALAAELQAAVDLGREAIDAPGAVVAVLHPDEGLWIGASGVADVGSGVPVDADDLFRIGSITKVYVATVVLQLDGEGALGLDDVVADWVPWAPHGDRYTVRDLLQHTSGLPDHVDDLAFLAGLSEPWTAEALVAIVADEPLRFEPGTAYAYSNTGYAVLGAVIEAATGRPWGEAVQDRILAPLGLEETFVPSVAETPPIVRGYLGAPPDYVDITAAMHPTAPGAGGELVATARDVARFARALLVDGALLDRDQLAAMQAPPAFSSYGLGLALTARGDRVLVGHSGSTSGFQSRVHVLDGVVVVTTVNSFTAEADLIDAALWDLLE